ncbi:MAG: hypothetical protein WAZ14_03935 [Patescibacteria group bacterium]
MSVFSKLLQWKLRWAALTGFFTLIVLPLGRLIFGRKGRNSKSKSATDKEVIDIDAEEIKG